MSGISNNGFVDVHVPRKEESERNRYYGFLSNGECQLKVLEVKDLLEICEIGKAYNKTGNPIMHTINNPSNGLPMAVYALIEKHHLDNGQSTCHNRQLANEIRLLGGTSAVEGKEMVLHECAQVLSPKLGGKMERQNLFPILGTMNFNDLLAVEKRIYDHIDRKVGINGRAYLCFRLAYETPDRPNCPTRMEFCYTLMTNDSHGSQVFREEVNAYLKVYVPQIRAEIHITDLTHEQATNQSVLDRESQRIYEDLLNFNETKNLTPDLVGDLMKRVQDCVDYLKSSPELCNATMTQLNLLITFVKDNAIFGNSAQTQSAIQNVEAILGDLSKNFNLLSNQPFNQ